MELNPWPPVWQAVWLLAVDPSGLGGLVLRGGAGPQRDAVLAGLRAALPAGTPWRRLPVRIDEQRLSGGLDLGLSLAAGRPVTTAGLLAEAAGGVLVLPMAERVEAGLAARLVAAMDAGRDRGGDRESGRGARHERGHALTVERKLALKLEPNLEAADEPTHRSEDDPHDQKDRERRSGPEITLVALDEGQTQDEALPGSLRERLGLMVTLDGSARDWIGMGTAWNDASAATAAETATAPSASTPTPTPTPTPIGTATGTATASPATMPSMARHIAAARACLPNVTCDLDVIEALCVTAQALGLDSMRTVWQAWSAARAAAALAGRTSVEQADAEVAARLVLAPRARALPGLADTEAGAERDASPGASSSDAASKEADSAAQKPSGQEGTTGGPPPASSHSGAPAHTPHDGADASPNETLDALPEALDTNTLDAKDSADCHPTSDDNDAGSDHPTAPPGHALQTRTMAAAKAAIPAGLLQSLCGATASAGDAGGRGSGRHGAAAGGHTSGRPLASRRGPLSDGRRLDLVATLRAAVPWQRLRAQEREQQGLPPSATRLLLRREDVHLKRFQRPQETTTLFVVDASGSQALNRLAEAKGAVELLLADCYVRRDRVALLAFRGDSAELLLTPTRSLARARRALASLPGGGGTPLAAGIEAAWLLGRRVQSREGGRAVLVFLTDARANVALDGSPGRERAVQDALLTARRLRLDGLQSLLIDTAPRPLPTAMMLAQAMGARYVPLPHGQAAQVYAAVSAAVSPAT